MSDGARCRFSYCVSGEKFVPLGDEFPAVPGRWVGAKIGVFASTSHADGGGRADFDWFRVATP